MKRRRNNASPTKGDAIDLSRKKRSGKIKSPLDDKKRKNGGTLDLSGDIRRGRGGSLSYRQRGDGGRLTLSADSRRAAADLAEKRSRERSAALHAKEFSISDKRAIFTPGGIDWGAIPVRLGRFFGDLFARLSVSREIVIRAAIAAVLLVLFALLQTTLFTRLPPFGAVPDLMLCFCVAIAVTEGEHFGAIVALFAGLVITALGSVSFDPAPVLYLICAYTAGVLCRYMLKQNVLIRALLTLGAGVLRALATLAAIAVAAPTYTFAAAWRQAIWPEFLSTLVCAPFVHLIVWLALLAFHRSRAQRTGES